MGARQLPASFLCRSRRRRIWARSVLRRSLPLQVGHFLGLAHPFPDERQTCNADADGVADTPLQHAANRGCDLGAPAGGRGRLRFSPSAAAAAVAAACRQAARSRVPRASGCLHAHPALPLKLTPPHPRACRQRHARVPRVGGRRPACLQLHGSHQRHVQVRRACLPRTPTARRLPGRPWLAPAALLAPAAQHSRAQRIEWPLSDGLAACCPACRRAGPTSPRGRRYACRPC